MTLAQWRTFSHRHPRSEMGRPDHFGRRLAPSGLPRATDILGVRRHVSKVPDSDVDDLSPPAKPRVLDCFALSDWLATSSISRQVVRTDKWSTRVFASPSPHGSDNRAEVATLGGQHVLGARRTHRIEAPLHDAMLLKCPKTLRQRRRRDAVQRVLQVLKTPFTMQEEVAQDEASPVRSDDV
jgi:hypothetical protein